MAMDEKIVGAFEYALETENGQLFDSLAAVFAADGNGTTALMLAAKGTHSWRYDVQTTLDDLLAHGVNRDDAVEVAVQVDYAGEAVGMT